MIGLSGMGWKEVDYTDKESVIRHFKRIGMIAECIEIPFISPAWISGIKDGVRQNEINIDSVHLPKQFVYEDDSTRNKIAIAARFLASQLDIKKVIVHPFDCLVRKESIEKVLKSIQLIKTDIMFEATSKAFMDQMDLYGVGKQTGLTIDISHYMRIMNENLSKLSDLRINHVHLRGYVRSKRYARMNESKDIVERFLNILIEDNYEGNVILEYPYSSYKDAKDDVDEMKELLGKENEVV